MKTFFSVLALGAMLVAANAACPNQCSGHGTCGEDDKCSCYKQTGTTWRQRVGWTGADCSQRTCPLGIAYDTISTTRGKAPLSVSFTPGSNFAGVANAYGANYADAAGSVGAVVLPARYNTLVKESKTFMVRVVEVSGNQDGTIDASEYVKVQWKLAEDATYSAPMTLFNNDVTAANLYDDAADVAHPESYPMELKLNGAAAYVAGTGVFIYHADADVERLLPGSVFTFSVNHQEGRPYEYGQANEAHQQVECSGRGSCDRGSGRCTCVNGYTGEACQRTVCPNDCSAHGVCQDLRRFAGDVGGAATYNQAYDAKKQMGCLCDAGFRGPDCSMIECPSGADVMGGPGGDGTTTSAMDCSGRGLCDYSAGLCTCFKGYTGERCEVQTNFV